MQTNNYGKLVESFLFQFLEFFAQHISTFSKCYYTFLISIDQQINWKTGHIFFFPIDVTRIYVMPRFLI